MLKSLRRRVGRALRYKLLALVLVPLLLALAVTLGYSLYRLNTFVVDSLHAAARNDLARARAALRQVQDEQLSELQLLAESREFRVALRSRNAAEIQRILRGMREQAGFAFLHVTGVAGNWLYESGSSEPGSSKPSPLTDRAARGLSGAALEVFRLKDLQREAPAIEGRSRETEEPDATLMMRAVFPLVDLDGRATAMLDAGRAVNPQSPWLDPVFSRTFTRESPRLEARPVISLLVDGQRVATFPRSENPNLGAPGAAVTGVVEAGEVWVGREESSGHSLISAYGPLFDVHGQRIGMLHVGFSERAFTGPHYRVIAVMTAVFFVVMILVAWITVRGVGRQLRPLESMAAVVRATQAGETRRIGPIGSRDEVADLARQFDTMLDLLESRNREIRHVADELEIKVAERTQELTRKNVELENSVRQLEEMRAQLVHAEKLSALGQMAAGIAHELNNPAAVILGNIQLLEAELGSGATAVGEEIRHICQQVERIRHIVTSLLQFASPVPSAGTPEAVDPNAVVTDVLPLVKDLLHQKSVVVDRQLEARRTVLANVFDLEQVLINLVVNATNAVEPGGRIWIKTSDVADDGVEIRVRDDGVGVAAEDQARIFDPFFTTDPRRGAGLGLSVSYGLVQRHGGRISLESEPGRGSLFRIWLPSAPATAHDSRTHSKEGAMTHDDASAGRGSAQPGDTQVFKKGRHPVPTADRGGGTRSGSKRRAAGSRARARTHDP